MFPAYIWVMDKRANTERLTVTTQTCDPSEATEVNELGSAKFEYQLHSSDESSEDQVSLDSAHGSSAASGDENKPLASPECSRNRKLEYPQALELVEFDEIIDCDKAGVCRVKSVPGSGLDRLTERFNSKGKTVFAICCTNQAVADFHAAGVQAALIHQLILDIAGRRFKVTQSRLKRLRPLAGMFVRQAARKADLNLTELPAAPDEIGLDLLKAKPKYLLPEEVVRAFWCRASMMERSVILHWTKELTEDPAPLIGHLKDLGAEVVVAVNWLVMEEWYRALLASLARENFRVVVVADPRAEDVDPWRSLRDVVSHTHLLSVSVDRSAQVLSTLSKTEAGLGANILTLSSVVEPEPASVTEIYESRERLISELGLSLGNLPGLTPRRSGLSASCDLGIRDLRGKTALIVVHTKAEAIEIKRDMKNYFSEPVEVLGNSDLWIAKLTVLCRLLDPVGFVSGEETAPQIAAASSLKSIIKAMSDRFFPTGKVPAEFSAAASVGHVDVGNPDQGSEPLDIYVDLAEMTLGRLSTIERRGDPEVALASRETSAVIRRHISLLRQDGDNSTRDLVKLAHELFDMRALGYEQSASGSQRWYVWPTTYRERGGSRLDVASHLERQRENPWGWNVKIAAPDRETGAVFVTHIQRLGSDLADHVIICRTSKKHMPYVGGYGTRADPDQEAALFYRAVASARESVHMLSIHDMPYRLEPVRDHRSK